MAIMCSCHSLGYVLIGLVLTSFRVGADEKHPGVTTKWITSTVEDLSSSLFQSAKRNNASGLPPRIQLSLAIPSTSTVGARNFLLLKTFTQKLVQEFSVSPSGTRVAMVTYSSTPRLVFRWNQYMNMKCTLNAISSLRYVPGQRASLNRLFHFLKTRLYYKPERHNPKVDQILFVIVESSSLTSKVLASLPIKSLEDKGVRVFILTVGKHVISSNQRTFRIGSFADVSKLSYAFRGRGFNHSCSGSGIIYDECNRLCYCKEGKPSDCHRIRKDFIEMPLEERRRFVRALKVVSMQNPYKRTYDIITRFHFKFFDIIHEKNLFFPWHRWYISVFENLLRHVDCRVTVPYWNWARAVSRKRLWRHTDKRDIWNPGPHGFGGDGDSGSGCVRSGPFSVGKWYLPVWHAHDCLSREFDRKMFLPGEWYVNDLNKIPWNQFNKFESGVREYMHNDLHNAVGGTMSEDSSALAPEFWCHHAFLDKVWSNWQDHGPKYKFIYFKKINKRLPGGAHFGWEFMDLQHQPHCIQVLYDEPIEEKSPPGNEEQATHRRHRNYGPDSEETRCYNNADCEVDGDNADGEYDRDSDNLDDTYGNEEAR